MKTNNSYIITGYERSEGLPTTAFAVGAHRTLKAAQRALKRLKNESLNEFADEFVALETDVLVVLMSCADTRYSYTMVISNDAEAIRF